MKQTAHLAVPNRDDRTDDTTIGSNSARSHLNPTKRDCTRRSLLRRSLALGTGVGAWHLLGGAAPVFASHVDYASPGGFDAFVHSFELQDGLGQSTDPNEWRGALAWGQAYVQLALLRMFEAYRDLRYLDDLIGHVDEVLASRDSVRGVTDYRGLSLPAWRASHPYTAGAVDLQDEQGRPTLQVRSLRSPIEEQLQVKPLSLEPNIEVTVATGTRTGTFSLAVHHRQHDRTDVFDNLSMDPASPGYVTNRVHEAWPTFNLITVKDLRAAPAAAGEPAAGTFSMASQPAIFGVHTGQITYPIAGLARIIEETPTLNRDSHYRAKADEYVEACEAAVAVHDWEWRENDRGEGWYDFGRGSPVGFDGAEQPANQFLALGRTALHLAALTGKSVYIDRAKRMARTFKNQLTLDDDNAYVWHYWPTWGRVYNGWAKQDDVSEYRLSYCCARQIEDISHAHIDVDFAAQSFRDRSVFTGRDMQHFAKTFTRNVRGFREDGTPTVWSNVDATGAFGSDTWGRLAALWMPVAFFDEEIFSHNLAIYTDIHLDPNGPLFGSHLLGVGNLAWFAGRGQ